jgi:hypothetical protein
MASYAESLNALNSQIALGHQMQSDRRRQALARAEMARSIGDAEMFAEEMNKASGKGFLSKMLGRKMYTADDMKTVARPRGGMQELSQGGEGYIGEEEAARGEFSELGKRMLQQAESTNPVLEEIIKQHGKDVGKGVGLAKELATGYGPKAQQALDKLNKITNESAFNELKMKAMDKAANNKRIKDWQDIPTEAEEQYQYHFREYQKNPNNRTFAELANQYKLLDNKFGWNMSSGLGAMRPPSGGGGNLGGGAGGKYYINLKTGERREKSPASGPNAELPPGWIRTNESGELGFIKKYEDIIKDPMSTQEQRNNAIAMVDKLTTGRVKREIVVQQSPRDASGFAAGIGYNDTADLAQGLNPPQVNTPATASNDQYIVGKTYRDAQGRKAKYLGNGKWGTPGA